MTNTKSTKVAVTTYAVYASEGYTSSSFERACATLSGARRCAASLQRKGFGTAIRASHTNEDGMSWCTTVETYALTK